MVIKGHRRSYVEGHGRSWKVKEGHGWSFPITRHFWCAKLGVGGVVGGL